MTRAQLRTQLQACGFGTASTDVTAQDEWLKAAYSFVWNAADWSFKRVDLASLSVTAGDSTPSMPTDYGRSLWVMDQTGAKLAELSPAVFDELYQPGVTTSSRGGPAHFKVVNRQITLGPVPDTTATFAHSYERRISHFNTGALTVYVPGPMDADTDEPAWPDDHHMVIVYHAAMVGMGLQSSPSAATFQDLRDDALEAMKADLVAHPPRVRQWGRRAWL